MKRGTVIATGAAALIGFAPSASSLSTYTDDPTGESAIRDAGGNPTSALIDRVFSSWDPTTSIFRWESTFSAPTVSQLPTSYVLVTNDGPEPHGVIGTLPTFYFDAQTDFENPIVNVFTYNGAYSATAYQRGTPSAQAPTDPPEPILSNHPDSTTSTSFVNVATVTNNADGTRTFVLEVDATDILAFSSEYGAAGSTLQIGYDDTIGIWFHPFVRANPNYNSSGFLADSANVVGFNIQRGNYGWYDLADQPTDVPEPGLAALLGGGLLLTLRRRAA